MSDTSPLQKPDWIKVRSGETDDFSKTMQIIKKYGVGTICEEALCPNIGECWKNKTATFVIMGNICTRNCSFCNLKTGTPHSLDPMEPEKVALSIRDLGLKYVVITSVTRDDLPDGGASHFAETILKVKEISPGTEIEVLTSDFSGDIDSIKIVTEALPNVLGHNIEIVQRLHHIIKNPPSEYNKSMEFLKNIKKISPNMVTKSGLMVGVGENKEDVVKTFRDLFNVGVDIVTIGQYLCPSEMHYPVARYITLEEFQDYKDAAINMGFKQVVSGPLVRSSFRAREVYSTLCSLKR
ncbi:MAG: lipoyl synthase [Holosporales bacterium]|jgi:lipoic acid synthetase|nr:lipoyl synthase [Holosporales bacterium]